MAVWEEQEVADEENDTYFPHLSIGNLFVDSSADKVCLYYHPCIIEKKIIMIRRNNQPLQNQHQFQLILHLSKHYAK